MRNLFAAFATGGAILIVAGLGLALLALDAPPIVLAVPVVVLFLVAIAVPGLLRVAAAALLAAIGILAVATGAALAQTAGAPAPSSGPFGWIGDHWVEITAAIGAVVTAASAIANLTPTDSDNKIVAIIAKLANLLAVNWTDKAKP